MSGYNKMADLGSFLDSMKHSGLANYIVPGLTSSLIGRPDPRVGSVRMFTMDRNQDTRITPHSHRFDFYCLVLEGSVYNTVYRHTNFKDICSDLFEVVQLVYDGKPGEYKRNILSRGFFERETFIYQAGEVYSMRHDDIHSIEFSAGAKVLFFEGPYVRDSSFALLPVVNGEAIDTLRNEPWMFRKVETKKLVPPLAEGFGSAHS